MTLTTPTSLAPQSTGTSPMPWRLVGCLPPTRQMATIRIDREPFIIGRRPECHLPVQSARVSGRHAELLVIGANLFVRDLGSTNGTFVNRRRIHQPTRIVHGDHIELADLEFRIERDVDQSSSSELPTYTSTVSDMDAFESDWVLSQLDRLIRDRAVAPYFQSIVSMQSLEIVAYEALARSTISGLETPHDMFSAARQVNREVELSQLCRLRAVELSVLLPGTRSLFINTHPGENLMRDVFPSLRMVQQIDPGRQLVLEVHEAAIQNPSEIREFRAALHEIGVQLAYDDFGAGQSRMMELIKAPPDYLKFDGALIRSMGREEKQQRRLIGTLVRMVKEMQICPLAEGIETQEEFEMCRDLGFELGQGYFFGHPRGIKSHRAAE